MEKKIKIKIAVPETPSGTIKIGAIENDSKRSLISPLERMR